MADLSEKWLLEPDYHEPYKTWSQSKRTPADNNALLTAISPLVDLQLRRFAEPDRIALRPKAKLTAITAMKTYDPAKSSLNTFLSTQMLPINREYNQSQQIIHMPENMLYDKQRILNAASELEQQLGRPATTYELSDHLKISVRKIDKIMSRGASASHGQFLAEDTEGVAGSLPAVNSPVSLQTQADLIYPDLNPRDQLIMEHSLGLYGKRMMTPEQLARKLKTSVATISLRKKFIQNQLESVSSLLR